MKKTHVVEQLSQFLQRPFYPLNIRVPVLRFPVCDAGIAITGGCRELRMVNPGFHSCKEMHTHCLCEDLIAATLGVVHHRVDLFLGRIGFYCNN